MEHPDTEYALDPTLYSIQQLATDFAQVPRSHWLAGTEHHESDSDHTIAVTLLCWYILEKHELDLDEATVLKYAISHDIVEARAGDVNAFASAAARQQKARDEAIAREEISEELAGFGGLVRAMHDYENKEDNEAVFVWTVDKMQALIMGEMDDWRPYRVYEGGISYEAFCEKYRDIVAKGSPHTREIFEAMVEYFIEHYYDQPIEGQL